MRATAFFVVFFLLFTVTSIAVSVPLFPGNMIHTWFGVPSSAYTPYVEAVTNGLVYGFVTWMVFFMVSRRMDKALSKDYTHTNAEPTSTSSEETLKEDFSKPKISGTASAEQREKTSFSKKSREEHTVAPERNSSLPNKMKKTESSKRVPNSGCPHHFGYLRKHPRDTRIPNQCLICSKVMECMSKKPKITV